MWRTWFANVRCSPPTPNYPTFSHRQFSWTFATVRPGRYQGWCQPCPSCGYKELTSQAPPVEHVAPCYRGRGPFPLGACRGEGKGEALRTSSILTACAAERCNLVLPFTFSAPPIHQGATQ